jgi:YVTN family beta-propeller protein
VPGRPTERFLTAILFTDIVGSTEVAAELGDRGWRDLVQEHHRLLRAAVRRHQGREVDTAGDGFFVIFDAPAAAAECALEAVEAVRTLGIQIRAGLHVGEVEHIGAKVGGIAVPTAARIMAAAGASEIYASGTVRDLAAGSGLRFEDRGERELKGVPGAWRLYAVMRTASSTTGAANIPASTTAEERASRRAAAVRRSQARPFWKRHPRLTAVLAVGLALAVGVAGVTAWSPWRPKALAGVPENSLGIIAPDRNEIVAEARLGDQPAGIAVSEGAVWVTNAGSNTVLRIDPNTHAVVDTIDVGLSPAGIAVGGGSIWVADSGARAVTRINEATAKVVATIEVGNGPTAVAYGGGAVWVTNARDGTLTKIDATSGVAAHAISVGASPNAIAIDSSGIWVASQEGASVSHLDPDSGTLLAPPIPVGSRPGAIAIAGGSVWVANSGDGSISRIDPAGDRVVGVIDLGGAPSDLAVDGSTLWIADSTGAVLRVDTANASAPPTRIATASAPQVIARVSDEIWFASRASAASHRGGTLRVVGEDVESIDPVAYGAPELQSLIGDTLVGYRRVGGTVGGQLLPHLATAIPTPTDGGLTYAFHLRPGIVYSDGTPLKPGDFVFGLQRAFQVGDPDIPSFGAALYGGLVGADDCQPAPVKRCDLSDGILADDAAQTVTFHLARPDPDFLFKLGMPFAHPLRPGSVPADAFATEPFPVTGPYEIASVTDDEVRLVRNPHFHTWDAQVRPDGFVNEIVFKSGITADRQVQMVEYGAADYMLSQIPADAFEKLETQFTPQLHLALQKTTFLFMNTALPPFDDVAVRQAVSLAIDRSVITKLRGGTGVTRVTCQVLPPNFPGYEPYCPYTADPAPAGRGPWTAPDLAAARQLIARSGAAQTPLVVGPFSPRLTPLAGYVVDVLRDIGFRKVTEDDAADASEVFQAIFDDQRVQMGAFEFISDFPSPYTYMAGFTCVDADGLTNYCDPAFDDLVRQARELQTTDPAAAGREWAEVDRKVTDLALWCPLINEGSQFVSERLGNYQYNVSYSLLLDQAWVQ